MPPTSYFVDTNVLIGLSYYSDRWFREARDAFENGHPLHTSELVVYEYCVSPHPFSEPPANLHSKDIDWNYDKGVFGRVQDRLEKPYAEFRQAIRHAERDGQLTLDLAIEEFIDHFEIRREAQPQIRGEFYRQFDSKPISAQYIGAFVLELVDKIIEAAERMKERLAERVTVHDSVYHIADETRRRWQDFTEYDIPEVDLAIITDAAHVIDREPVEQILSGDGDFLAVQQVANEYFGFGILSMSDEYSLVEKP